jgi:hypothetical protein
MAVVARASKTVRNKNILIILMCAGFLGWFGYDGFVGYPASNDRLVEAMGRMIADNRVSEEFKPEIDQWNKDGGWNHVPTAARDRMNDIVQSSKNHVKVEGWKSPVDVKIQQYIVYGLATATVAAIWWFFRCQRRRAIADETTVSPAEGVVVPWEKITRVDNTRWKSTGIVEITFPGPDGTPQKAKFDDYETEREPLLSILDMLAEKAVNAEFLPKEEAEAPAQAS